MTELYDILPLTVDPEGEINVDSEVESGARTKRTANSTEKGKSYMSQKLKDDRSRQCGQVTKAMNEIRELLQHPKLIHVLQSHFQIWKTKYQSFLMCHDDFYKTLTEAERNKDIHSWFAEKDSIFRDFKASVELKIEQLGEPEVKESDVKYVDDDKFSKKGADLAGYAKSECSSVSSTRIKLELKCAELKARSGVLTKLHQLEEEESKLKYQKEKIKFEADLAAMEAQVEVMNQYENSELGDIAPHEPTRHLHSQDQAEPTKRLHSQDQYEPTRRLHSQDENLVQDHIRAESDHPMSHDNTAIMKMIVDNHRQTLLPRRKIAIFTGDALEYKTFIQSFRHNIESKTEDYMDRLYYLEQFTQGEPHNLIRSCLLMADPKQGYLEACRLLDKKFGNKFKVATAYIDKALNWSQIMTEDSDGLNKYSMFLIECLNGMDDIDYLKELEHPSNMKLIISKLPYKLRDRWRGTVYRVQEKQDRMVKFKDLVEFVEEQAEIMSDPLFGKLSTGKNTSSYAAGDKTKQKTYGARQMRNFAVELKERETQENQLKSCVYCSAEHTLEHCTKLREKSYEEKLAFLKSKGLCFGCLSQGHLSKFCKNRLTCQLCKRTHATILHSDTKPKAVSNCVNTHKCFTGTSQDGGSLPIVPVRISMDNSDKYIVTNAFLDQGSTASFISEDLLRQLCVNGRKTNILLHTMGQRKTVECSVVTGLVVCDLNGERCIRLPKVYTQEEIPVSKSDAFDPARLKCWDYLKDVSMISTDSDVQILIGSNVPEALEPWEVINSQDGGPYAVKTLLGWTVNGPLTSCKQEQRFSVNGTIVDVLHKQQEQYFNCEFSEKLGDDKQEMSRNDEQFMDIVSSAELKDGHYEVPLPFKKPQTSIPNNRSYAIQRMEHVKNKFQKNMKFKKEYTDFMDTLFKKGYAEKVDDTNVLSDGTWYVPHHGVYHPKKPDKIRVVYDCSASYQGTSLNDQLLQGPDLTNSLLGVLLRFRQENIALMADIEAMFYQVKVPPQDRSVLRFLWWPDGDVTKDLADYQMTVHVFGAVSSPSVANFALKQTARDNISEYDSDVINTIEKNFYVDDCLKSVPSESEAIQMAKNLTEACGKGGFHLTKWLSNNRAVLESIPETERAKKVKDLAFDQDSLPIERALGMQWCIESDRFKFKIMVRERPPTRRGILSVMSSVYDPLGFLAPFVLPAKTILQELCQLKYGWDDEVPEKYLLQWKKWLFELTKLEQFSVNRCLKPKDFGQSVSSEIHHFSDASETGYGTVSYLRQTNDKGEIQCSFLLGKSRVAPLKKVTIPRMELSAATTAVKVDRLLRRELEIPVENSYFWTDSMSVLRYIWNVNTRFQTFVANRLAVIHGVSKPTQWRHIETNLNPADDASRGLSADKFLRTSTWINGPNFLHHKDSEWPNTSILKEIPPDDIEVKQKASVNALQISQATETVQTFLQSFSDWNKLKRATAWILRVKNHLRNRIQNNKKSCDVDKEEKKFVDLTLQDLNDAEYAIIQFVQRDSFPTEVAALQKCGGCVSKSSPLYKLDPFIEDDVLKVGGRLGKSNLSETSKHPVIVPRKNSVSQLLIQKIHEDLGHSGRNHVQSYLQSKYWIPKSNSAIRTVIHKCVICRRQRAKSEEQKMADLPLDRVTPDTPPFSYVGVDYFGPFEVKRGRAKVKRYGVIFTCLAIRAVHIEIANSLETDSCVNALRRFIARRGQVRQIRSDNGTNLVAAEKELRSSIQNWNRSTIQKAMLQKNVQWIFNPPSGSHHGGVWERQIRTIRQILSAVLKEQVVDEEALHTIVCEAEAIINSRPLTRVSCDPNDLDVLTPNHLLLLKCQPNLPPGVFSKEDIYVRRRWKQIQYIADLFWKRWIKEYLPLLQVRQKWSKIRRNVKVGDIVLIVDNNAPRNSWPMARVVNAFPDKKGFVRSVQLQTKSSILTRPIDKLCMLLENDLED